MKQSTWEIWIVLSLFLLDAYLMTGWLANLFHSYLYLLLGAGVGINIYIAAKKGYMPSDD